MTYRAAAALVFLVCAPVQAAAQAFGQNHVVIRQFQWKVRSTEHFDIHYYGETEPLVPQAAEILERSYAKISARLGAGFTERRPLFLYANPNDFEQSNIAQVGDGTGGITEPFKNRFMVYNDGTQQWFDDVLTHEMTHVFQYSVLISGFWKSIRILKTVVYPLWMMEGMAEFMTGGLDDDTEAMYVRDAATSGTLIPLYKLEHFSALKPHQVTLGYKSGAAALEFLESQYGEGSIGRMLKLFDSHFEASSVLQDMIGLDFMDFDRKWQEYTEERYRRMMREDRLQDPWNFGVALTTSSGYIPEFNTSPVLTPDGRTLAYTSSLDGFPPQIVAKDLATGKIRRVAGYEYTKIENIPTGNFTTVSRVIAVSPDGRTLAFGIQKNHEQPLYLYDLRRETLTKIPLPGLTQVMEPAFSPDGTRLAFSAMKGCFTDIYLLDLKTRAVTALTSDPQDDQSPTFAPDGQSIVYSSEVRVPDSDMPYQRRLYRLSLADHSIEKLEDIPGAARDPVFSPDGSRLLFTVEGGGFQEVYELDLGNRRAWRLTRSVGASFTPSYASNGDILFSSFRRGSIHIYRAKRAGLLSEEVAVWPKGTPNVTNPREEFMGAAGPKTGPERKKSASIRPDGDSKPFSKIGQLPGMSEPAVSSGIPAPAGGVEFSVTEASAPSELTPERPFKDTAGTDLFLPAFFYSSLGGAFWTSYWQGSDMLGNHQAGGALEFNTGAHYLNYQTQYAYTRYRPEFILAASGLELKNQVDLASGLQTNYSNHAQAAAVLYPLDRYHRLEASVASQTGVLSYPALPGSRTETEARDASIGFVRDTVGGRYLVETRGSRLGATFTRAAHVVGGNVESHTGYVEGQKFLPTGDLSTLALRAVSASSWGGNARGFVLGGLGGVRGYARSTDENVGSHMALATAEYRFPLLKNLDYYMWYIFPDFYFKAVTMYFFTDAGYAWSARPDLSQARWHNVRNSYGAGLAIHTFLLELYPFEIHMDYARRTTGHGGIFYVYLGPLF